MSWVKPVKSDPIFQAFCALCHLDLLISHEGENYLTQHMSTEM